ncbi:MAG: group III truncated hemoglobin [Sphingomonadales bacterium]|nr:group III truncated hemoglobin [Sphingomonadales bacterium]MDE2569327.1 group III truncated hemoglobin [Sphingomonadales bacterium]
MSRAEAEAAIAALVPAFYERVRADALIGPVFAHAVEDWDRHHARLVDFWSSVMMGTGRFKGSPMQAHLRNKDRITPDMFDRWLALWNEVTGEMLPSAAANEMQARARAMAESFKLALFFRIEGVVTRY